MNKENSNPSVFPDEMPAGEDKKFRHGVIVDVVTNEIYPKPSANPAQPADTDSLNTEFAKRSGEYNL
ncbi:MAG: hypothetical protein IJV88_05830 [Ruminococcus sp.]|nr:hypothetical protein [Ruminococcus sp.]